jgi:hypothetical protein
MTHGHKLVLGHYSQKHIICISKNDVNKHLCQAAHIGYGSIVRLDVHNHVWDCAGDETDVIQDRLERKKYMGMWRWESEPTARMMSRFPSTVITFMDRNSPKMMEYRSGFSESPIRRNIVVSERFAGFMLMDLTED